MTPQDLIQFRNEQNSADSELEFLAFLLNSLRKKQDEQNELIANNTAEEIKIQEKIQEGNEYSKENGEITLSLLSSILDEIHKKDIDLSAVINGLETIREEISASRQEERDTEPMENERHNSIINTLSELIQATKENKQEETDLTPLLEKTDEAGKKTQELLSALLAEISTLDIKPEVKIDIPKEVEIKEPKWYKPFSFETKWLKPIEYAINAINPKPAIARIETLIEKISKKQLPKVPLNKDGNRVLVEVDRTGSGGTGVMNTIGTPVNPATEEKQDDIVNANYPSGTGSNGSVTLTLADTAYAVPTSAPTSNYIIILYNSSDTDQFIGFANSNANGILLPAGGNMSFNLGASQSIYAYCATAGSGITYSFKEV